MESPFEPARLSEWLQTIATTEDDEIDCDALFEAAEQLIAAGTRGANVRAVLPRLALHLDHCPDCRELYDTVMGFSRQ
jgi:hypothetical protein